MKKGQNKVPGDSREVGPQFLPLKWTAKAAWRKTIYKHMIEKQNEHTLIHSL